MLSEEEKTKVKAEEIYRSEIRDEINQEKAKDKPSRLWIFVNSSIFLWFLSTVAVGGITYVWTVEQNRRTDERIKLQKESEMLLARKNQIDKLNLEIEGRLSQFLVDVEQLVEKSPQKPIYNSPYKLQKPYTGEDIFKKWTAMKISPRNAQTASVIYSEFADRGIVSLIVELDKLQQESNLGESNTENNSELKTVVARIQSDAIFDYYDKSKQNEFLPIYLKFQEMIMRREWSATFPYMDCGGSFPFC